MQQHSGEHIFSGIVHSRFGYDNVGFHLSDNIVTMDFNGVLTADEVREVETAVNEVIVKNLPVEITYPSKEELKTLDPPTLVFIFFTIIVPADVPSVTHNS